MENIHTQILSEIHQDEFTRKDLYQSLEKDLDERALVTFFTSFSHPVSVSDNDADMLQSILQHSDTSKGVVLMVNSPGGDGLAAERIVNICRSCSGTGDYWVIVAGKAKSAATMIAMGASKIMMPPTAELGPVDPQILVNEGSTVKSFSAHSLVNGYDKLFNEAVQSKGRLEPYLQQLNFYDDRDINEYRSYIQLSEEIAVKILRNGMLSDKAEAEIKQAIDIFLIPEAGTLSHGRPIYGHEAQSCGLNIENIDVNLKFWKKLYRLYVRLEKFVTFRVSKVVESKEGSFNVSI